MFDIYVRFDQTFWEIFYMVLNVYFYMGFDKYPNRCMPLFAQQSVLTIGLSDAIIVLVNLADFQILYLLLLIQQVVDSKIR